MAALDGLRALAVIAVIAYHLGLPWAQGGMLGVGVFFTLSGYLITDLLLGHWRRHGELGLREFWLRRARRLLPALFVMLAVVSVWVALFDASLLSQVRRQVVAAVFYSSNWSTIAQQGSYFARFAAPLPLDHLWSLAIEEQFYLLWPWLLLCGIWALRGPRRLALATLAAAIGSLVAMALLYHPGYDPTRVYEGTDTRAFALLLGATLAIGYPSDRRRTTSSLATRLLDAAALAGLVAIFVLVWRTNPLSPFLYPAGFALLAVATVVVIAAAVNPESKVGAVLGLAPLRWIGVRSYGIYLWQWPIIVLAIPARARGHWLADVLAVAAIVVIASLSWRYVEDPIRHGALGRVWRRARAGRGRLKVGRAAPVASGATTAALVTAVLALTGALPVASTGANSPNGPVRRVARLPREQPARFARPVPARSARTDCRSVVYIGDSTSEGETSSDYIPSPTLRLPAQLHDIGVSSTIPEISGARSIVETFEGYPNAATVAQRHVAEGFSGCWILALGTNDVDNVHDGSPIGFAARISRMMSIVGPKPVLWINAVSLLQAPDPYSEQAMQRWNDALLEACHRYPTMRIFDWSAQVRTQWFISDGIHYNSPGYVERTHLIAQALATAFPATGQPSPSCVVR